MWTEQTEETDKKMSSNKTKLKKDKLVQFHSTISCSFDYLLH